MISSKSGILLIMIEIAFDFLPSNTDTGFLAAVAASSCIIISPRLLILFVSIPICFLNSFHLLFFKCMKGRCHLPELFQRLSSELGRNASRNPQGQIELQQLSPKQWVSINTYYLKATQRERGERERGECERENIHPI